MNDQDKEAFVNWYQEYFKINGITILNIPHHFIEAWQAACEYKQKEYSNIMDAMTQTSQYNSKLQAENAKLRECVEFYAGRFSWTESEHPTHEYYAGAIIEDDSLVEYTEKDGDVFRDYSGGKRARQVLKKLEPKNEKTQSEKLIDDLNAYAKQALKELDAKKGLKEQI